MGRVFFTAAALCVLVQAISAADDCVLAGRIQVQTFRPASDKPVVDYAFDFQCWKGARRWAIESAFLKNAKELFTFDETNVYKVLTFTAAPDRLTAPPGASPTDLSPGDLNKEKFLVITPGEHPLGNAGVNMIWLALCSENYLQERGRRVPLPICEIRHTLSAFSHVDMTRTLTDGGLPEQMELREAPKLLAASREDPRFTMGAQSRGAPAMLEGRLACSYRVLVQTNYHGRRLPTEFELTQFSYDESGDLEWKVRVLGSVESIGPAEVPPIPFNEGVPFNVTDLRFRSQIKVLDALLYRWNKGNVPDLTDAQLSAKFVNEQTKRPPQGKAVAPQ